MKNIHCGPMVLAIRGATVAILCLTSSVSADEQVSADGFAKIAPGSGPPAGRMLGNGDFEQDLNKFWGTFSDGKVSPPWRNRGGTRIGAAVDTLVSHSGERSLRIVSIEPPAAQAYGETAQLMVIEPDRRYRVSLFARADGLASRGGVSVLAGVSCSDEHPLQSVIELPAGSYPWTRFTGEFTFPATAAELIVRCDDIGQVWLDDLRVDPVDADQAVDIPVISTPTTSSAGPEDDLSPVAQAMVGLIRQYKLDPNFVHVEGPLFVEMPRGRLLFWHPLLRFEGASFPMEVELTSSLPESGKMTPTWTVTGRGWDQPLAGWKVEFDGAGLRQYVSPDGEWIRRKSNADGVLQTVSTSAGFGWRLELDNFGGIAAVEDTSGRRVEFVNRSDRGLIAVTGPSDEAWSFTYSGLNRLVGVEAKHIDYAAEIKYYPDGKVWAVVGRRRLEFDYVDRDDEMIVNLFGRDGAANVYRFAKDGTSRTVGVFQGPHVEYRYNSSGQLVDVEDSMGRRVPYLVALKESQGFYDTLIEIIAQLRWDREEFVRERIVEPMERARDRAWERVDNTVGTATDLATGGAAYAGQGSPEQDAESQERRRRAAEEVQDWPGGIIPPALRPLYEAVAILSNPDDAERAQDLVEWIDREAQAMVTVMLDQSQTATRNDMVERVRERIREPFYDRLGPLPARLQNAVRGSTEWIVGRAVDRALQEGRPSLPNGRTSFNGQSPSDEQPEEGGNPPEATEWSRPGGQNPPVRRPPAARDLTDSQIKDALVAAFSEINLQPWDVHGPDPLPAGVSWAAAANQGSLRSPKGRAFYDLDVRRFSNHQEALRDLETQYPRPPGEKGPPSSKMFLSLRSHKVWATIEPTYMRYPATNTRPERWARSACMYRWLLDSKTVVRFSMRYWPNSNNGRPQWAGWSPLHYAQKTRPFLDSVIRVLDEQLGGEATQR